MSESILQMTIVSMIRTIYPDFVINLSLNGISLNGLSPQQKARIIRQAKLEGMENGIQDFSLYVPDGVVLNLELKTTKGKQSADQIAIQAKLNSLGHNYHLIRNTYEVFGIIAKATATTYREQCFEQLAIEHNGTTLTTEFLHFSAGTALTEVHDSIRALYYI